ncbi:MAG: EAL domain-containing protein [Lysobacter sp.]
MADDQAGLLDAILVSAKHYGIVVIDPAGTIKTWNSGAENIFGYTAEEIMGQPVSKLFTIEDQKDGVPARELEQARRNGRADDRRWHRRKDGTAFWADGVMTPITGSSGELAGYVKILRDATEQRENEMEVARLARVDSLTGLANRAEFDDRLKDMTAAASRHGELLILQLVDLDHFKQVNDRFGHYVGDLVLREAARRMQQEVRETDLVARIGGDEFVVLQPDASSPEVGATVAEKLVAALSAPYHVDGINVRIGVSIGISVYPQDATDHDQLLRKADLALYRVKDGSRNGYHYFTHELDHKSYKRSLDIAAMHRAVRDRKFLVHYQPEVDAQSGQVVAMEALLRCTEPALAEYSIEHVIDLAMELNLMEKVSLWLLAEAATQLRTWEEQGIPHLKLCVNLCAAEMVDVRLPGKINATLARAGLKPTDLEVEITERELFDSGEKGLSILADLRSNGTTVAIDDFGSGYSSLSYLNDLPVDAVKLDRSFLRDIPKSAQARTVAGAVVDLVRGLDLQIVVEGVETAGQAEFVQQHTPSGLMQGYFVSPPLPAPQMTEWLVDHHANGNHAARPSSSSIDSSA